MNVTPKVAAVLLGSLVLAWAAGEGGLYLLQKSGEKFAQTAIPRIVESGSVDAYLAQMPASTPQSQRDQMADDLRQELKDLPELGAYHGHEPAHVSAKLYYHFPSKPQLAIAFNQQFNYEAGPVAMQGGLSLGLDGWHVGIIIANPSPQAQIAINQSREDKFRAKYPSPREDNDGYTGYAAVAFDVEADFFYGRLVQLDNAFNKALANDEHMEDGDSRLMVMSAGVGEAFGGEKWDQYSSIITQWRAAMPSSSAAAIVEAAYWNDYAWDARGHGYAGSVTVAGSQLFHERLQKAQQVLLDSKPYASVNPLWYSTYITVAMGMGDTALMQRIFDEGVQRFPDSDAIYQSMMYVMLPQWYGSNEAEDRMIRAAAATTAARNGTGMYARLYWAFAEVHDSNFDLFRDSLAQWPLMHQAFDDLVARHPGSYWLRSKYAAYACQARDGATFNAVMSRLGDKVVREAWAGGRSFDLCQNMFAATTSPSVQQPASNSPD